MHMGEHKQYWHPRQSLQNNSKIIHDRIMQKLHCEVLSADRRSPSPQKQLWFHQNNKVIGFLGYLSQRHLKSGKFIVPLPKVIKIGMPKNSPVLHSSSLMHLSKVKQSLYFPKISSIQNITLAENHSKISEINKISPYKAITKHKKSQIICEKSRFPLNIKGQSPDSIMARKLILESRLQPIRISKQIKKQQSKIIFNKSKKQQLISGWRFTDQEFDYQF